MRREVEKVGFTRLENVHGEDGLSLRETLEAIRHRPTPSNEESTKFRIIRPVLDDLGWDTTGPEVLLEHQVGTSKSGGKVDIALRGRRRVVALIEAKAPREDLDKHVEQVIWYAFYAGISICVLTNGPEWRFYLPKEDGPPDECCFARLDLTNDPIDRLGEDLDTFLGKENLLSGAALRRATEVLEARRQADRLKERLPEIWSRMVTEPDVRLVDLVIGQAYEEMNLRPAAEQVKAVLRGLPVPAVPKPEATFGQGHDPRRQRRRPLATGTQEGMSDLERRIVDQYETWNSGKDRSPGSSSRLNSLLYSWFELAAKDRQMTVRQMAEIVGKTTSTLRFRADRSDEARKGERRGRQAGRKIEAFELWGIRHDVASWAAMLVGVAEALYKRHGASFDRILTLRGTTRLYASRDREDISYNPKLVGTSGIYIETHGNVADKIRRAGQFLELFRHSPDDLRIETRTD